jgi:hypothetical protein
MIKKLGKIVVICLIVIGGLNVVSLNKSAFNNLRETITTKPVTEIPGGIVADVFDHQWKFVR